MRIAQKILHVQYIRLMGCLEIMGLVSDYEIVLVGLLLSLDFSGNFLL